MNPVVAWIDHGIIIHVSWQCDLPWCCHEFCNNNLHELAVWFSLIRPRKNGLPSMRPILCLRKSMRCLESGLVSRSASWSFAWTWRTTREFFWTRSRTKCKSIWMCFMQECWTGLKLRLVAQRLSHKSSGGWGRENFISVKSDRIHIYRFKTNGGKHTIFSFRGWSCNSTLLSGAPWEEIWTKHNEISWSRVAIIQIASPIRICITCKRRVNIFLNWDAMENCIL